ncbi:uncharacterized protein LOC135202501 isoform X3 [Macrobrachium nipponense]|uniref:uncharacterized protein LOC135202501 isoform X3 n=1 Tax=Macrobrachium nipponense TaxID=159736 RepID=UPI0030C8BC29
MVSRLSLFSFKRTARAVLLEGEEEAPSFAALVKQFKRRLGKTRLERWLADFKKDKSLEDIFALLWNDEDAHCYMSPVLGNGGKDSIKSAKLHKVADSFYKVGDREKAYDYFNLSLILAPHPRVAPPYGWFCEVSEEPDEEPDVDNSTGGNKDPENKRVDQSGTSTADGGGDSDHTKGSGNSEMKRGSKICVDKLVQRNIEDSSGVASECVFEPMKLEESRSMLGGSTVVKDEGKEGVRVIDNSFGKQEIVEREVQAENIVSIIVSAVRDKEVEVGERKSSDWEDDPKDQEVKKDPYETSGKKVPGNVGNGSDSRDETTFKCIEEKETGHSSESQTMSSPKLETDLQKERSPAVRMKASASIAESRSAEEESKSDQAAVDESLEEVCDQLMTSFSDKDLNEKASLLGSSICLYADLVTGLEMRALLMFKFREFERSITAIDLAIRYGSTGIFLKGIKALRVRCEEFLGKGLKPKSKDKLAQFLCGCQPTPVIKEANPKIPALSASVKCKYTHFGGKFLVAAQDIRPGDILGVEEPYCSIVNRGELMNFCANCLQRCCTPIPCPDCSVVVFCSEDCRMKNWKHPHWPLCNVVLPSLVAMKMDSIVMLAAHVLTQTTFLKAKEMAEELKNEERLPGQLQGFNQDGIFKSSDYRSVYHLVTNEEKRSEEERFIASAEAFALTKLLKESNRYFIDECGRPFTPTYEDMLLTGSLVVRHLMNLKCSAIALSEFRVVTSDYDKSWSSRFGCGVYPTISIAKHSCNPNAALYNHGKTVVMFATRSIPKNTPITLSYVTQFRLTGTDVRRSILEDNYYFRCSCEACENDWFPDFDEIFELKCFKCSKAIDLKTGSCPGCQIYYREGKEYKGSEKAPYNFFLVKDKLYQAASICKKTKSKMLSKGDCSGKNRTSIVNAIELMEKYVKEPCSMLLDAQEALRISYLREGSWFQVKEHTRGWIVGPQFLINSSLTGKDDVHFESYSETPLENTPRRKGRGSKHHQESDSTLLEIPPPPYVPILNRNEESASSDLDLD